MNTPTPMDTNSAQVKPAVIREKPMAEAVEEFLRSVLPEDADSISVSIDRSTAVAAVSWSIYEKEWWRDEAGKGSVRNETLEGVLKAHAERPDRKQRQIAELKARLAVLEGKSTEVPVA